MPGENALRVQPERLQESSPGQRPGNKIDIIQNREKNRANNSKGGRFSLTYWRRAMSLYRVMRAVGFEHGDIVGGLLPEDPAHRLDEKQKQLADKLRRLHAILV